MIYYVFVFAQHMCMHTPLLQFESDVYGTAYST